MKLTNPKAWDVFAGGTAAAPGRYSYSKRIDGGGEYHIDPVTNGRGIHRGYLVQFANTTGNASIASGLWHEIKADGCLSNVTQLPVDLLSARRRCEQHRARVAALLGLPEPEAAA